MVKAYYKNNLAQYKKLCAFHLFVARGIRSYSFPILFLVFSGAFFAVAALSKNSILYVAAVILLLLSFFMPLITLAMQNAKIEKNVRNNKNYEKTEQFYEFYQDHFHLLIRVGGDTEEYDVPYSQVLRIYERKDNFYMYIGGTQVLILDKNLIEEQKVDELAYCFRALKKRFKEKKKLRKTVSD